MPSKRWYLIAGILLAASVSAGVLLVQGRNGETATESPPPSNANLGFHDLVLATDDRDLVELAHLIIHGVPVGDVETAPHTAGSYTKYYQDVRILSVLKGATSEETLRVLQPGIDRAKLDQYKKEKGVAVFVEDAEYFPGPLAPGPQILFLHPKAITGVYPVVGFRQGAFLLGPDGRVADAQEFKSFEGLTVPEVKQRIEELSQSQEGESPMNRAEQDELSKQFHEQPEWGFISRYGLTGRIQEVDEEGQTIIVSTPKGKPL